MRSKGVDIKKKLFECDPDKNVECRKTGCMFRRGTWGVCHRTTNPEYAWDGKKERGVKDFEQVQIVRS